ncbi:MAG: DUF2723 domain-containing protein [Candidatus Cloacimonetes bacterium]|nr:DUF2723 domain-containing protein [Candidatus Cloacimonadota bacterium]MDD4155195.1 DUF2723 domain-containing protein [Candidatus Cloacimonadota bacterium]
MAKKIRSSEDKILKNVTKVDLTNFKPKTIISVKTNTIIAIAIFLFTLLIYQLTNSKSTSFWDAGEYISCSSILGVPHPPGNPFYILLGRFFCIFSLGFSHAMIISFLSSLLSALGVMFTYLFTVQIISMWNEDKFIVFTGGFIAAILTAFSFTYWMNAIEAEVYAGLAFTINIIVWLTFLWVKKQDEFSHQNLLLLIAYIFFLGFGIHQTALQIAPAVLFIVVFPYIKPHIKDFSFWGKIVLYSIGLLILYKIFDSIGAQNNIPVLEKFFVGATIIAIMFWYLRKDIGKRVWLIGVGLMLIGFSSHLFLLIRSEFRPFINEGHPHNFELFMNYILRRQYGDFSFLVRRASLSEQFGFHFLRYFSWQFLDVETVSNWFKFSNQNIIQVISNLIVTFLGLNGFVYAYKKNKNAFWMFLSLFFMASIAMVLVMNLSDAEVRDRDYFFVTAYNFWAVAMGIGAIGLLNLFKNKKILKNVFVIILLLYPMINLVSQYNKHDRTGELISLDYGLNILNSLEENAIVFTNGDNDTFPLWYAQAVYDPNTKDKVNVYPATEVYPTQHTQDLISAALEIKNREIKGVRKDVTVANLSLLNTPWYLKQLRDLEGVELTWSDEQIDKMIPFRLDKAMEIPILSPNGDRFTISLESGRPMLIKDFSVIKIIQDNFGKRPIYFAVTCSDNSGFENYLINEGMVDRVTHKPGKDRINYERLSNNLKNLYLYRGVFDDNLYQDENMKRLIMNYGAAYLRLSDYYQNKGELDLAVLNYEKAMSFVKDTKERVRFHGMLALMYAESGKLKQVEQLVNEMIENNPNSLNPYFVGAIAMFKVNENELAFDYAERAIAVDPYNKQLVSLIVQYGIEKNMRQEAHRLIEMLVPYQPELREYLDMIVDPEFNLE